MLGVLRLGSLQIDVGKLIVYPARLIVDAVDAFGVLLSVFLGDILFLAKGSESELGFTKLPIEFIDAFFRRKCRL